MTGYWDRHSSLITGYCVTCPIVYTPMCLKKKNLLAFSFHDTLNWSGQHCVRKKFSIITALIKLLRIHKNKNIELITELGSYKLTFPFPVKLGKRCSLDVFELCLMHMNIHILLLLHAYCFDLYDIHCYIMFTSVTRLLFMFTFNSLVPGRCGSYFKSIHFRLVIQNDSLGSGCHSALRWMSQNLTNEKSALVQVMAWCFHFRQQAITWASTDPDLCHH